MSKTLVNNVHVLRMIWVQEAKVIQVMFLRFKIFEKNFHARFHVQVLRMIWDWEERVSYGRTIKNLSPGNWSRQSRMVTERRKETQLVERLLL